MVRHALEDTRGVPPCKTAGKLILRKKTKTKKRNTTKVRRQVSPSLDRPLSQERGVFANYARNPATPRCGRLAGSFRPREPIRRAEPFHYTGDVQRKRTTVLLYLPGFTLCVPATGRGLLPISLERSECFRSARYCPFPFARSLFPVHLKTTRSLYTLI